MASHGHPRIIALGVLLAAAGAGGYLLWPPVEAASIVGIVRATEIRVAPEVGGQLAAIKIQKGDQVRAGDVVAELSALELTASVGQARATLAAAAADRDHVYAGVRDEEIASLAAEIAKAKSRLAYMEAQLTRTSTLARSDIASQQALDQAQHDTASARADVAEAEANHAAAKAGPKEEQKSQHCGNQMFEPLRYTLPAFGGFAEKRHDQPINRPDKPGLAFDLKGPLRT